MFVAEDSLAEKRPVMLGRKYEMNVEVIRGLNPGDRLITKGQMLLEDKTKNPYCPGMTMLHAGERHPAFPDGPHETV